MECPECGPSKDYDLLFNCQQCGRSYCDEHKNNHGHQQQASFQAGKMNVDSALDEFARSFYKQMQAQMQHPRRKPTDQEYEAYLRENPRILTTGRESLDLMLGIALIAWVFGFLPLLSGNRSWQYIVVLTLIISPAFIIHELAHKYMAIRYGKYARFALVRSMAMFTFIAGLLGIPIAGPGATMILGRSSNEESGIFSAAGPATNFVLSGISYLLYYYTPATIYIESVGLGLGQIFLLSTFINAILGVFNMLPFGSLDGKKIMNWNVLVWIILVGINAVMIYLSKDIFNFGL